MVGKRSGGDQSQVSTKRIEKGVVAEKAEGAGAAASRRSLPMTPEGVRIAERNVFRKISAFSSFRSA